MKKSPAWLIFIVIAVWAAILFWAFIIGLKKTFRNKPDPHPSVSKIMENQHRKNEDMMEQQKRLLQERQQKIKDMQDKQLR